MAVVNECHFNTISAYHFWSSGKRGLVIGKYNFALKTGKLTIRTASAVENLPQQIWSGLHMHGKEDIKTMLMIHTHTHLKLCLYLYLWLCVNKYQQICIFLNHIINATLWLTEY